MKEKFWEMMKLHQKKIILLSLLIAVAGAAVYVVPQLELEQTEQTVANNLYREEEVSTGDIVVGVTEAGSVIMQTDSVSYDFSSVIEEVYVKAGQVVAEGDPVAKLDLSDLDEEIESLNLSLADARLSLESATLSAESDKMSADKNYLTTEYYGLNASSLYDLTLLEIQDAYDDILDDITSYKSDMSDVWDKLQDYEDDFDDDYDDLQVQIKAKAVDITELEADIVEKEAAIATKKTEMEDYLTPTSSDSGSSGSSSELEPAQEPSTDDDAYKKLLEEYEDLEEELETLENNLKTAENKYDALVADLEDLEDDYEDGYEDLEDSFDNMKTTLQSLYRNRDVYESTIEILKLDAEAEYNEYLYLYDNIDQEYSNTIAQIDNNLTSAQLTVSNLEDELADYLSISSDGMVYSPCDGYIMTIVSEEDELSANSSIVTVGKKSVVEISVSIPQEDIIDIYVGMETNIVFDAYEEMTIPSEVDSISIVASGGTSVNYTVTIACDISEHPEMVIYQGMTCDVTFIQRQQSGVIMISSKCVTNVDGKQMVKVKREDGTIEEVEITTGFSDGFDVEVTEGLSEGDIVIIESAVM